MSEALLVAATERELFAVDRAHRLCCGVEAALATAHTLTKAKYLALLHVGNRGREHAETGNARDRIGGDLLRRHRSDVEAMEGFGVLRAAGLARVPALEVRGVDRSC